MSQFSSEWLALHDMRRRAKQGKPLIEGKAADKESELHREIMDYCKGRQWLVFHGSMAHRTFRTPGEPDFICVLPSRVLFIEAKTKAGKLSTDQLGVKMWLEKLGHQYNVVKSLQDFIAVAEGRG